LAAISAKMASSSALNSSAVEPEDVASGSIAARLANMDSTRFVAWWLPLIAPPSEAQVQAQEQKMLALRRQIGTARWCQLYSAEMAEAYLIYKQSTRP
jgi:hypothetical protein